MLGFTYLNPDEIRKNRLSVKEFLDEEKSSPVITSGRAKKVFEAWVKDKSAAILEVAPGTGMFLKSLDEDGYRNLHCADIDNYLDHARIKDFKILDFSFEKLPWPDKTFDAVASFETVEHLENPYFFIREIRRVLKNDGIFIMSMPNVQHMFNRIFFFRKGDMPRWRKGNNHLWVVPKGVFEKSVLKYFNLVHKEFFFGFFPWRFLSRLNFWPENEKFGHTAIFVLKPK